jgi:hypothetical protein
LSIVLSQNALLFWQFATLVNYWTLKNFNFKASNRRLKLTARLFLAARPQLSRSPACKFPIHYVSSL